MSDFSARKTNAIWTSPSGKVFILKTLEGGYKRKHSGETRTTPNDTKKNKKKVADSSDTFIDMGVSGKDITLECLFVGSNHDLEAEKFENALCETGKSRLKLHYGKEFTVNVIEFSKNYSVVKEINITKISVNFHQTSNETYPSSKQSKNKDIKSAVNSANSAVAQNVADIVEKNSAVDLIEKANSSFSNVLTKVTSKLDIANNISLNSIISDISAQVFTSNPFTVVSQLQQVMIKSANLVNKVKNVSKLKSSSSFASLARSWNLLINDLISADFTRSNKLSKSQVTALAICDMATTSLVSSICSSAIDYEFETRKEAMQAAVSIVELDNLRSEFIDEQINKIDDLKDRYVCDSGIDELVNTTASAIIDKSFDLKIEKNIILDSDKTIIELAYEYYKDDFEQNPEETIDFLISSNSLNDDDLFMLKRGTKLKLYV